VKLFSDKKLIYCKANDDNLLVLRSKTKTPIMKFIATLALVFFSFTAMAQVNNEKASYQLKIDKYKRMKTGGVIMIVAGCVSTVVGISQLSSATSTTYTVTNGVSQGDPKAATGTLFTMAGLGLLGGGIPLTIIGSKKSKYYQRKLDAIALHININPQQQGLALSYKF
jgi:uncharacterized membrane protein